MELIAAGTHSVEAVCRVSGMSILELAAQVCTPRNLEALGRVKQLHAIELEMMLGKLQRDALVRLGELTDEVPTGSADEVRASEVMRKACGDLLRSGGGTTRNAATTYTSPLPDRDDPPEPLNEEKILEALERWGEKIEEEEKEVYPQITQIAQMGRGGFKSGSVEPSGWSKAEPQATRGGEGVEGVEITHDVQVGMAFGKTSDHGTGSSFDQRSHSRPGSCVSGSYLPTPPEKVTILTRTRRVPLEVCNMTEGCMPRGEDGSRFENGHPP